MISSNKRKEGKCQRILRKSSEWCNWDMKRKGSEKTEKETKKEEKKKKGIKIQEKEEQLMINFNEAKLMNEENWIETTKMRKNLKKLVKKFVK